jgi:hypothetical protein
LFFTVTIANVEKPYHEFAGRFNTIRRLRFEPSLGQILVNIHVHVMTLFSGNTVF